MKSQYMENIVVVLLRIFNGIIGCFELIVRLYFLFRALPLSSPPPSPLLFTYPLLLSSSVSIPSSFSLSFFFFSVRAYFIVAV